MSNRTAIITGASSGIGKAVAYRFAKKNIRMVLNGRNEEKLISTQQEINQLATNGQDIAQIVSGSVTDKTITDKCIEKCEEVWKGSPDIFIASAGRGLPGTVINSDSGQWDDLIDTNVKGIMYQLKSISGEMIKRIEAGHDFIKQPLDIVVIGSGIGRNVSPFNSVYGATKFATHGVTEALRRQLGPKGIRVSLIEPGIVSTNFQENAGYSEEWFKEYSKEVGPVLVADDVAAVIDFLVDLPGNVHLDNISIRPTRQSYP
jgi:NADP-dependent 3-hydroxy acid dehydrogenase YdfG